MGLGCQVKRTKSGKVESVIAFNGEVSKLYRSIKNEHPELTEDQALRHYAKFYTNTFRTKYGDFVEGESTLSLDENGEPNYLQDKLNKFRLSNKLESGFLKELGVTVHEYDAINKNLKADDTSISDFITLTLNTKDITDITKESVFFAYMYLGRENAKLKSELKYNIHAWSKYDEKFELYSQQITDQYGFMPDKKVWINKVRDQIIIDFLTEELVNFASDPKSFKEKGKEGWSEAERRAMFNPSLITKLVQYIRNFFQKLFKEKNLVKKNVQISNLAANIAHEMINQEYRIFNYKISPEQVKVEYQETLNKDPMAKMIVELGQDQGLLATGSLALRAQGEIFRSEEELIHDIDFEANHKLMRSQQELLDQITVYQASSDDILAMKTIEIVQKYDFYKAMKQLFPDMTIIAAFSSNREVITVQAAINGEYYKTYGTYEKTLSNGKKVKVKHVPGQYIVGSGYHIDIFLQVKPPSTPQYSDRMFTHWKNIMIGKFVIGSRKKDMTDLKHFVPFVKEDDNIDYTVPQYSYTNVVPIVSKPTANVFEKLKAVERADEEDTYNVTEADTLDTFNKNTAFSQITAMAEQLGKVEYEFISANEARQITDGSLNPYDGEPALFYKNKVYFIGNNITPDVAFHELSHPFVRYIKETNRPLFEKLFSELHKTSEGQAVVSEAMKELGHIQDPGVSDAVKEEAIVKGLTIMARALKSETPVSKKFNTIISKILYHIKQFLRKVFGRTVKIENLDVNTKLNDLAKMLVEGKKFNVNTDLLTESDIVAYNAERKKFSDEIEKAVKDKKAEWGVFTDNIAEVSRLAKSLVDKDPAFATLKPTLIAEGNTGPLALMVKDISKYTTEAEFENREQIAQLDEADYLYKKINAVVDNILGTEVVAAKVSDYLKQFENAPDSVEAMIQMYHYNRLLSSWKIWAEKADRDLNEAGITVAENGIRVKLAKINTIINDIDTTISKSYQEGLSDVILAINPINAVLEENHKVEVDRVEKLIKHSKGKAQEAYKQMLESENIKYDRLKLSPAKIKLYLAGAMMEDNHVLNAWLFNYIGNPDPIVGSFGLFLKNNYTEVGVNAHIKFNEFIKEIHPLMKKQGYNATQIRKLSDLLLFEDNLGYVNEFGELEEYKAHTFLNRHLDYKADLVKLENDVKLALAEYRSKQTKESEEAYAKTKDIRDKHKKLFFYNKYNDEIYKIDEKLANVKVEINGEMVDVGIMAKAKLDLILDDIQSYDKVHMDSYEVFEDSDTVERLWMKYRELFSERDEYSNKPKVGLDLEIAKALKAHREAKSGYYQWKPVTGNFVVALEAFEVSLDLRLKKRELEGEEYDKEFADKKRQWLKANTRIKIKDSFYTRRAEIFAAIKEILDALEEKRLLADSEFEYEGTIRFDKIWETINDSMAGKRDSDGQPVGIEISEPTIEYIKEQQEEMAEVKKGFAKLSGLTEEEFDEHQYFFSIIKKDPFTGQRGRLDPNQSVRFKYLSDKKTALGLDKILKNQLLSYWAELEEMQSKIPTEYYMEVADKWYQKIIRPELEIDESNLTHELAERMLNPKWMSGFLNKKGNEEFKEWFDKNHILTTKWDPTVGARGEKVDVYERVHVWNVTRPNEKSDYENTTVTREDGTTEDIEGIPTIKYSYRSVKGEHMTGYNPKTGMVELEVGVHQDNQDKWLPLPLDKMREKYKENPEDFVDEDDKVIPFDKYVNHKYFELQRTDEDAFKLLETLKKFHLEYQEKLNPNERLGYELPRYRKDNWEYALGNQFDPESNMGRLGEAFKGLAAEWTNQKDNYEEGLNYEDEWKYTQGVSMFAPTGKPLPLTGRYKLDAGQASMDIMQSMMKHMFSIEMNSKLKESQPIAHAFKSLINNLKPSDVNAAQEIHRATHPNLPIVTDEGKKKRRSQAVNAIYETWWEGKKMVGIGEEGKTGAVKVINKLLGMASHAFFAFDMTSALKNYFGASFQIGIEAATGKYMNYKDYSLGKVWALKVNSMISTEIYSQTTKSLELQLMSAMDPIQGREADKFGTSPSRSLARDVAGLTWTTSHRKWFENLATLRAYSGIMHSIRVEQTINGNTTEIRYIDAWQLNPDTQTIELKEGIDETWGLNGDKFKMWVNRIHEVSNFNQGMYSQMDSAQADRYIIFKSVISMRKFAAKMFMQRYSAKTQEGFKIWNPTTWDRMEEKWNPALQDFHMGHYAMTMRTFARILNSNAGYIQHMTKEEKMAIARSIYEPIKRMLWMAVIMAMFGLWDWDPDDPDRWKKMRARSGALPGFETDDEWEENFNSLGFMQNHALLLMLSTDQENSFFLPTPHNLMQQFSLVNETSITSGPTIELYLNIMRYSLSGMMGNDEAFYKKDTGAMWYQQEGSAKVWKYINKMLAMKGKFTDPVTAIKNQQGAQNR